jgi:hypothetical protein
MERESLHRSLERLRSEVDALGPTDGQVKARLNGLIGDLEHQLSHMEDAEHRATVIGRVRELIEHFETEHPAITGVLNHIMVTLSGLGA